MKESYIESIASYAGPESYADGSNILGVATAGVCAGKLLSSEIFVLVCPSWIGKIFERVGCFRLALS
jgi:hypothetical protein